MVDTFPNIRDIIYIFDDSHQIYIKFILNRILYFFICFTVEHHGLAEFLEAQGIGWMKRKIAVKCNPVDNIQIGDNGKLTISYTGRQPSHVNSSKLPLYGPYTV